MLVTSSPRNSTISGQHQLRSALAISSLFEEGDSLVVQVNSSASSAFADWNRQSLRVAVEVTNLHRRKLTVPHSGEHGGCDDGAEVSGARHYKTNGLAVTQV